MYEIKYLPDPVPYSMSSWGQLPGNQDNPDTVDAVDFDINPIGFVVFVDAMKHKVKAVPVSRIKSITKVK